MVMIALVMLYCAVGMVLGAIHFVALRRNVGAYVADGFKAWTVVLHVARLMLVGLVFVWLARRGGVLVLAALAGFTVARLIVARRAREGS
jgi:F1F0 ATPase subunit 2